MGCDTHMEIDCFLLHMNILRVNHYLLPTNQME